MALFYKWLDADGRATIGGDVQWSLPTGKRAGKWMPKIDEIKPCERGYHLCRPEDVSRWIGERLFVAEARGDVIVHEDSKVVVSEARLLREVVGWDEQSQRVFACLCAYGVLDIFERKYPDDLRPRNCVDVAWRFAFGEATVEERDAARDAWAAAWATDWDADSAAWATARAVDWAAARAVDWAAARAAARAVDWAAARARMAAWASARAVDWDAARDAVRDAWAAARAAQSELLVDMLGLDKTEGVV